MKWWPTRWRRSRGAFSRLESQDLDLLMLPQYPTPTDEQRGQRAQVEHLIAEAGRESFDAGTREFLNNFINAQADKSVAELRGLRDDALALADAHVAMAAEKVALFQAPYEADLAQVAQSADALAVTFEELTGRPAHEFVAPSPRRITQGPIVSTLGAIDISDDTAIHLDADETPQATSRTRTPSRPRNFPLHRPPRHRRSRDDQHGPDPLERRTGPSRT